MWPWFLGFIDWTGRLQIVKDFWESGKPYIAAILTALSGYLGDVPFMWWLLAAFAVYFLFTLNKTTNQVFLGLTSASGKLRVAGVYHVYISDVEEIPQKRGRAGKSYAEKNDISTKKDVIKGVMLGVGLQIQQKQECLAVSPLFLPIVFELNQRKP